MNLWLIFPLFALAQASCYDYEYYDPTTGASQGNACAAQQAKAAAAASGGATVGQPTTTLNGQVFTPAALPSTTFGTSFTASYTPVASTTVGTLPTTYGTPVASFSASSAPISYTTTTPAAYSATVLTPPASAVYTSAAPVVPAATIAAAPYTVASTTVSAPYTVASTITAPYTVASTTTAPYTVASTVSAPYTVASTVSAPYTVAATVGSGATVSAGASSGSSLNQAEVQRLTAIAQQQNAQHQRNARIVKRASKDQTKASIVNSVFAGSGNVLPWYPAYRLSNQKKVVNAYRSEKQIANRNADDAYNRYLQDPTSLNMLISKYQDLNADLKGAAYQYNVVNAGTFGQRLSTGFLGLGGSLASTVSQVVTQREQSEDLQDIQRKMKRVARQITTQVQAVSQQSKAAQGAAQPVIQPGSVQQRMMALSTYGPAQGR